MSVPNGQQGFRRTFRPFTLIPATLFLRLSLALLVTAVSSRAEESQPSEYELKAAFLFNFAKFVEWPPKAFAKDSSPLVVGVLGEKNPFGDDLKRTVRNKTINNRPLEVKEIQSVTEATNCHILFICTSEKKRLPEILDGLRDTPALTVGETDRFIQAGGMINFVLAGNKIRFEINDDAAKKAGLKISSKLLSLALRTAH